MIKLFVLFLSLAITSCASSVVKNDIHEISPKNKTVKEIITALENKAYRCNKTTPTKYESESFLKAGHTILKQTCIKQTNTPFCVNSHFVYVFQDKNTKEALLLNGNTSPICIWTK